MQQQPDFFSDMKKVKDVGQKIKARENKLEKLKQLQTAIEDQQAIFDMLEMGEDESLENELLANMQNLENSLEDFKIETLLSGKYDSNNAILTLHAGAGGTEAQDWANMLFRMYNMFAEKRGFKINILDSLDGDDAGLKSITFEVAGANAYGYLKCEKGVHRLVRISPFDSNARRHTSFASLDVMPVLEETPNIEIRQEDLKIDTYRSSGAGGQHVNKTDSAVRITHLPTGIVASCQTQRSQIQNREYCMNVIKSKLYEKKMNEKLMEVAKIKGESLANEWGSQIRSYVFCPYTMVKDHRSNYQVSDIDKVMDGELDGFISAYLKMRND